MAGEAQKTATAGCGIFCAIVLVVHVFLALCNIYLLQPDEQLVQQNRADYSTVTNGPGLAFGHLYQPKEKRKAELLGQLEYAKIIDTMRGTYRVAEGPLLLFLDAYEQIVEKFPKLVLTKDEYVKVFDKATGDMRLEFGEKTYVPGATQEVPFGVQKGESLNDFEYCVITDESTGERRVERGPQLVRPASPYEVIAPKQQGIRLTASEYIKVQDIRTGKMRVERGTQFNAELGKEERGRVIFLGPNDRVVDGETPKQATNVEPQISLLVRRMEYDSAKDPPSGEFLVTYEINPGFFFPGPYDEILEVRNGIKLSKTQWVRIMNEATGKVQTKKGELVYFLNETEIVLGEEVNEGYDVNEFQAVLVESSEDGQKRLVKPSPGQNNMLFIPDAYDTVLEIRQLVHVQPHEAVITIDELGTYRFYQNANGTSFFLDPYDHLVTMRWSTGNILDEKETEIITKIDTRSQNLYFDFEVRTSDNVRLQLEGVVRWKVDHVEQMIQGTRDPRGDVWHHSRHILLQAVSKIDLQDFMKNFNSRVKAAFEQDRVNGTSFYTERGVMVESMEVTGYQCVDAQTADILQEIIRETTNRINRMQKQESENDVARAKLEAEIRLEKKRTDLLTTKASNDRLVSEMEGEASGLRLAKSAQTFLNALGGANATLPDVASRLELYRLHQDLASKNDTTSNLASGSAMLFVTPDEVNLKLQTDEL
jgi:hypothetical protein